MAIQLLANGAPSGRIVSVWTNFRHELLYVVWALMEVAIITPLFLAFMPWARYWSPLMTAIWLLAVMLIPFNLSRLMSTLQLSIERQRIWMVIGLVLTVLFSWRLLLYQPNSIVDLRWLIGITSRLGRSGNPFWIRDLAVFICVAFMWWRGISMVGRIVDVGNIGFRFRAGVLIAAPLVAGLAGSLLGWPVTPFILIYYFASLLAIVFTRVEQLELQGRGRSVQIGPRWVLYVATVAGLVALVTGAIASLVSGEPLLILVASLAPVWLALEFMLISLISIVSYLSSPLLLALGLLVNFLSSLIGPALRTALNNLPNLALIQPVTPELEELAQESRTLADAPRTLLTILIMLLVVLLIALALGRFFRSANQSPELESNRSARFIDGRDIKRLGFGRRLLQRLGGLGKWRTAASIRRIYRGMCETAAGYGYPRAGTETPYEYLNTLVQVWPENSFESLVITEAYNRVRYGEIPESKDELNQITEAWKILERATPDDDVSEG